MSDLSLTLQQTCWNALTHGGVWKRHMSAHFLTQCLRPKVVGVAFAATEDELFANFFSAVEVPSNLAFLAVSNFQLEVAKV